MYSGTFWGFAGCNLEDPVLLPVPTGQVFSGLPTFTSGVKKRGAGGSRGGGKVVLLATRSLKVWARDLL